MSSDIIASYPLFALSPSTKEEDTGITEGEHESAETTKKIWTAAEEREIENNVHNRELAYDIDSLVKQISDIKRFSILKDYKITSVDDAKYSETIKEIETFINEIKFMTIARQSFTPLQIHGATHLQKRVIKGKVTNLALLLNLEKYTKPLNPSDYYYFQSLQISEEWRNPLETQTKEQRVWYINEEDREEFTEITEPADKVFSRDLIIEILNSDSGESCISPIISQIFIKNFLIALLPNLITIVTSPDEEIIYKTRDAAGNFIVPQMPPASLNVTDSTRYAEQLEIYNTWKRSLQTLADKIASDRTRLGKTIHSDDITENIVGAAHGIYADMVDSLVRILNTEIAYGMGFSISLLNASGVALATARNIYSVIAVSLRGIQEQYETVAQDLIAERFPEAEKAGITFSLGELNPEDENEVAITKKIYAEIVEILYGLGYPAKAINNFASQNIDESLELTASEYSEATTEAAAEAIGAMKDYVELMNDEEGRV
jgi:hypothetical protein